MKKIFLSLSAVALLAVGTVSCGSDDSAPAPAPGLTENFGSISDDQFPLEYTWLGYESDKNVEGADFLEQALNPQDPTQLYVVWRFSTLSEDSNAPENSVLNYYGTLVDQTKTGNARYKLPFTTDSNTISLGTVAIVGDQVYQEGANDQLEFALGETFSYADGSENFAAVMTGTLSGKNFEMNVDHALDMLYYIDVDATAAKGVNNIAAKKGVDNIVSKRDAKLSNVKLK